MSILFEDHGAQGDPGTWLPFNVAAEERDAIREAIAKGNPLDPDLFPKSDLFCIRALTLDEETEIEMEGRAEKETFRMHIKTQNGFRKTKGTQDAVAEMDTNPRADLKKKIKRAVRALVDVSSSVQIATEEAAKDWSKAMGRPVAIGRLELRGCLTDAARVKVVTRAETILAFVLQASDAQKVESNESLDDELGN